MTAGELIVDTTAPAVPTATSLSTPATQHQLISGTATVAAGETLTVEVDGVVYTAGDGDLVDNGDGTWDLTIPAGNELEEATYEVLATVTDAAGNATSDATADELVVDITDPIIPTAASQFTNDTTPLIVRHRHCRCR